MLYKCKWIPHLHFLHLVDKEQELCLGVSSDSQRAALKQKFFEKHICDTQSFFYTHQYIKQKSIFFFFNLMQTEEEKSIARQKVRQSLTAPEHCLHCPWRASGLLLLNFFLVMHFQNQTKPFWTGLGDRSRPSAESVRIAQMKWNGLPAADDIERTPSPVHGCHILLAPCCTRLRGGNSISYVWLGEDKRLNEAGDK